MRLLISICIDPPPSRLRVVPTFHGLERFNDFLGFLSVFNMGAAQEFLDPSEIPVMHAPVDILAQMLDQPHLLTAGKKNHVGLYFFLRASCLPVR
jgi:hypothetical protein